MAAGNTIPRFRSSAYFYLQQPVNDYSPLGQQFFFFFFVFVFCTILSGGLKSAYCLLYIAGISLHMSSGGAVEHPDVANCFRLVWWDCMGMVRSF